VSDFIWDDLKYFRMVVSAGTVAGAARVGRVEHSTVTRRITRLENTLNIRLFDRLVRGWVLTEEGALLQQKTATIENEMLAVERFALSRGEVSGRIILTAPPDFLSDVLIDALKGFHSKYPEVDLCLMGEMTEANLSRGEADIAFRMTKVEGAELVTQRIYDVEYQFYGSVKLRNTLPEKRSFVGYSEFHQPDLKDAVHLQAAGRQISIQTNNLRVALRAASDGSGLALLPTFLAGNFSDLLVVEEAIEQIKRPVYMVMQRDVRKADRIQALTGHIKKNLRKKKLA